MGFVQRLDREREWTLLMLAARDGDAAAYRRLLQSLTPALRALARRGFERAGAGAGDIEDVVQETLLALHLKRHTWDPERPLAAWVTAIAKNKVIDVLRRRGGRIEVPLDDLIEILPAEASATTAEQSLVRRDVEQLLAALDGRQQAIVRAVSIEGQSIRDTAERLKMSEGNVRVVLHRALKRLAALYRRSEA